MSTQHPVPWLADVLRAAGLTVIEHVGWKTAGRPESVGGFLPRAVVWHHDGSDEGASPGSPAYITLGRPAKGEPGPLAQCWVAVDGTWHTIAAGRCNHAGVGPGWGVIPHDEGNTYAIGIETDHTTGETWSQPQLDALRRGTAAILTRLGAKPSNALCGHKEYAPPPRKFDPAGLDMDDERSRVAALMNGDVMAGWQDTELDYGPVTSELAGKDGASAEETMQRTLGVALQNRQLLRALANTDAIADKIAARLADQTSLTVDQVKAAAKDGVDELLAEKFAD